jgi:hypothetical protein
VQIAESWPLVAQPTKGLRRAAESHQQGALPLTEDTPTTNPRVVGQVVEVTNRATLTYVNVAVRTHGDLAEPYALWASYFDQPA